MKKGILFAAIAVMMSAHIAWAFDFSADMVSTAEGQVFRGKMYAAKDRVRMEAAGAITITRMDKNVTWVVMPGQNMYMEQPMDIQSASASSEKVPGEISRTLIGPDTIDGKATRKYRIRYSSRDAEMTVLQWIDDATGIPLKTSDENGRWSMEYKNLKTGPQDASLFEVPSGYQKFTIPNMQDMMNMSQQ